MNAAQAAATHGERSPEETRTRVLRWQDPLALAESGARMDGLSYLRAIAAGELPPPPIAVLLNFSVVEVERGRAVFAGEPAEEHYNPIGSVHGGLAATLIDSATGCAVHSTLPAGVGYTTLGLEVKFVRPIGRETERVRAEAQVVHRGRRQATAEARLIDPATEKLLATATTTCLIIG